LVNFFPPEECSQTQARAIFWTDDDATTRCVTPQQILKLALPGCKAGQQVVFDGNDFACKNAAVSEGGRR
jgi:hypothetical protein